MLDRHGKVTAQRLGAFTANSAAHLIRAFVFFRDDALTCLANRRVRCRCCAMLEYDAPVLQ
jgi:hypothetical protein